MSCLSILLVSSAVMALYWMVSGWMRMTFPCSSRTVCTRSGSVFFYEVADGATYDGRCFAVDVVFGDDV